MLSGEKGAQAEEKAADYLRSLGCSILERNYRSRLGEIDIIAQDGEGVVFVEVRSRARSSFGLARETVGFWKQRRIVKTAMMYALMKRLDCPMRFDVIAFEGDRLEHLPDAFDAAGF